MNKSSKKHYFTKRASGWWKLVEIPFERVWEQLFRKVLRDSRVISVNNIECRVTGTKVVPRILIRP